MSEFIIQIEKLLLAFTDPEYRYLALEPLIPYGILAGVGMLLAGFLLKAARLQVAALAVIGCAALVHFPYKDARLSALPRLEQVYKHEASSRAADFAKNTQAWVASSWQFRLLVLFAFVTLLIGVQRNRLGLILSIATLLMGLVSAKSALWLNYQDALAYHPNLKRHEAPIDRKTAHLTPPPAREPVRTPASRPAAPLVAEPVSNEANHANERIPPPQPPVSATRTRRVEPLPRF